MLRFYFQSRLLRHFRVCKPPVVLTASLILTLAAHATTRYQIETPGFGSGWVDLSRTSDGISFQISNWSIQTARGNYVPGLLNTASVAPNQDGSFGLTFYDAHISYGGKWRTWYTLDLPLSTSGPAANLITTAKFAENEYHCNFYRCNFYGIGSGSEGHLARPTTYGLFVGSDDLTSPSFHTSGYQGAKSALAVKDSFSSESRSMAWSMTSVQDNTTSEITKDSLEAKLIYVRSYMQAGDSLVLYIGAHGASDGTGRDYSNLGVGADFLKLDNNGSAGELFDTDLTRMLSIFSGIRKQTFLDGCNSGGFWDSANDANEAGAPSLKDLGNILFVASAKERAFGFAYTLAEGISINGRGFLSVAIEEARQVNFFTGKMKADEDGMDGISAEEWSAWLAKWGPDYAPAFVQTAAGPGQLVAYYAGLVELTAFATPDAYALPVPEVPTYIMALLGLLVIARRVAKIGYKSISRS